MHRKLIPVVWIAVGVFGLTSSDQAADRAADYFPVIEAEGGWRKNTEPQFVRSLGLDPEKLEAFGQYNLSVPNNRWEPYSRYKGILVIKNGWIVGEWYNTPEAKTFESYLSSNGKSFAMVLMGILMDDGAAGEVVHRIGPSNKVYDQRWLPQGFPLSDARKHSITFEQVFQHTSGLCPERTASGEDVEQGRNEWTDYVDWLVGHDERWPQTAKLYFRPGHAAEYGGHERRGSHRFAYSSVSMGHLGIVLQNVYKVPARDLLWQRLLEPMGFSGIGFHRPPSDAIQWFSAGGLRMNPRDYGRFAYLLLRDGKWGENQLVSAAWIQRFRTSGRYANILSNSEGVFGEAYPEDMFRIAGSGLNWAYIIPSLDLIALRTGRANNGMWNQVRGEFLEKLFAAVPEP